MTLNYLNHTDCSFFILDYNVFSFGVQSSKNNKHLLKIIQSHYYEI